jgi:hypothetical protein
MAGFQVILHGRFWVITEGLLFALRVESSAWKKLLERLDLPMKRAAGHRTTT